MPASIFTLVQTAVRLLNQKKETAACFVHTALLNVRQSRRMGNASVFDSSLTLPRSISPSLPQALATRPFAMYALMPFGAII